jgi:outer membrane protein assembly factor BamE
MLIGLWLSACAIHKIDIQQGNVLTKESLAQLSVGMDQKKVSRIAGSPLIVDPFRNDRWDYVFRFYSGVTGAIQFSYVTLFFDETKHLALIKVHKEPLSEKEINSLRQNADINEDNNS